MRVRHFFRPGLALGLLLAPGLLAAQATPDTAIHRAARLFRSKEPVVMWLSGDLKPLLRDRDSTSTKRFPATLRFLGEKGDTVTLDVQLATRGHFRLRNSSCSVPPIKVYFDKEKTKGTIFGGEGSLKLTTHCQKPDDYAQRIYIEYAIYGMYNALTPVSLQARLAEVHWNDLKDPGFAVVRPGFWTQDEEDMAKVNKGKIVMTQGGHAEDMDPMQMTITDLFEYMIGNTDFSMSMLHNYRIVQTDTSMNYFPMAYDFDWSGLVDAPYAFPDSRLPIKRVTDRLYRGACHSPAELAAAFAKFKAKKGEIYAQLTGIKGLDPKRLKTATDYLDEYFRIIDDPREVKREITRVCPS